MAQTRVIEDLRLQTEALRCANEALKGAVTSEAASEAADKAKQAREKILVLLQEAESLGMNEPFVQRLRAAHPAK